MPEAYARYALSTHMYSACPELQPSRAEDLVAHREIGDGGADGFNLSGELAAEDRPPRPAESRDEAAEKRDGGSRFGVGPANVDVHPVDCGGVDLDEYLIFLRYRPLDVLESQDLRRSIPVVDNRSHEFPFLVSLGCERRIGPPYFHIRPAR
jgi:hypothetical protein